ncbi:MAG TPA: hypothetical protein VFH66_05215 [Mycobacteriales bacterium]|nr:hypothetical protein [Mycobacteriales bacterium]
MTTRVRRIAVAVVAAALASAFGAGAVASTAHSSAPQRVVADNHWCC